MTQDPTSLLRDPQRNIQIGSWYLEKIKEQYRDIPDPEARMIAAYNAGESAVDRWEREIITDDIEEFVERIPYIETRGYVKLVMRNHRIYKKLYANNKPL